MKTFYLLIKTIFILYLMFIISYVVFFPKKEISSLIKESTESAFYELTGYK